MIEVGKLKNLYLNKTIVRNDITKPLNQGSVFTFVTNNESEMLTEMHASVNKLRKFNIFNTKTVLTPNTDLIFFNSGVRLKVTNNRADMIKKIHLACPEFINVKADVTQLQNLNSIWCAPYYFELSKKYSKEDKPKKLFEMYFDKFRRELKIPTKYSAKSALKEIVGDAKLKYEKFYFVFNLDLFKIPTVAEINVAKSAKNPDILRNFLYYLMYEAQANPVMLENVVLVFQSSIGVIKYQYDPSTGISEFFMEDEDGEVTLKSIIEILEAHYSEIGEVFNIEEAKAEMEANPFLVVTRTLTILLNKIKGEPLTKEEETAVSSRVQKEPTPEEVAKDELHLDNLKKLDDVVTDLSPELSTELVDDLNNLDNQYDNGTKQSEELELIMKKVEENRQRRVKIVSDSERAALKRMSNVKINNQGRTIEDITTTTMDAKVEPYNLPIDSYNGYDTNTMHNYTESYNTQLREQDIINNLTHFSTAEVPLFVEKVTITDTSDKFNEKETVSVKFKDEDGNSFTVTMDTPKVYKGNRIKLNSSEKVIIGQLTYLPILKVNDSVIITTNYNKLFMEKRYGNGLTPQANKLLRALSKMDENKVNTDLITYGDFSNGNKDCLYLSEEMKELSSRVMYIGNVKLDALKEMDLTKLDDKTYFILFSQNDMDKLFPNKLDEEYVTIGYVNGDWIMQHRTTGRITMEGAGILDVTIYDALLKISDEKELGIRPYYDDIKTLNKLTSTYVKVMDNWTPLIFILIFTHGLQVVLDNLGITPEIIPLTEKQRRVDKDKELKVQLADCNVYINVEDSAKSILLYPLADVDLSMYTLADLEAPERTADILVDYAGGNINFPTYLATFRDCLIDPITKDILASLDQPTDFLGVFIYANNLLASPINMEELSLDSCRIRYAEIVQGVMYKNLADAYGDYSVKKKRGSKSATMSIPKGKICVDVMALPNVEEYSKINIYQEGVKRSSCNYKGHVGKNLARAYTWKSRSYHPSYVGSIGLPTAFSANIGITKQLTINPRVRNLRGQFDVPTAEELDNLPSNSVITSTEAITTGSATHSDPPRVAMNQSQKSHIIPVEGMEISYYSNSYDKALPYLTEDFCDKAKGDGVIESVGDHYIIVRYNDKTSESIKLTRVNKNSAKGKFVISYMNSNVREGQKIKKGEIIAYDRDFIKMSPLDGPVATMGVIANVVVKSESGSFEDSARISERLSEKLMSRSIKRVASKFTKTTKIVDFKRINDMALAEDALISYVDNTEDDILNVYLDEEDISDLDLKNRTAHQAGVVKQINIYYACDKNELSPTISKLVDTITKDVMNVKGEKLIHKTSDEFQIRENTELPEEVRAGEKISGDIIDKGDVLVEYFIEYLDYMSNGDKLSTFTALKGIVTSVTPNDEMPVGVDSGRQADIVISQYGIGARKVFDVFIAAAANTLMERMTEITMENFNIKQTDKK